MKVKTEKRKGGAEKVRKKQRRALEAVTAKCGKLRLFIGPSVVSGRNVQIICSGVVEVGKKQKDSHAH